MSLSQIIIAFTLSLPLFAMVDAVPTPFFANSRDVIELKNDGFNEAGGEVIIQQGFVKGEKAGIWVKVPAGVPYFKPTHFRVLMVGPSDRAERLEIFFHAGFSNKYAPAIPMEIQNAAAITAGPYWNDIPLQGSSGTDLRCGKAGEYLGAAIEFTHDGTPSVARDNNGLSNALANTIFAVPGGWNYSSTFGLTGDWVLRVVGRGATAAECGAA